MFSRTSDGVGSQLGSDPPRKAGSLLPSGGGACVPFQVQLKVKAALLSLGKEQEKGRCDRAFLGGRETGKGDNI